MSYKEKYQFLFDSDNGTPFRIAIEQDGYEGAVITRALGSSPVLRRDDGGAVSGTSLEIYAECLVDSEFAEFYTTQPFEYRVKLYLGENVIWQGFVSTELYSEPDIAPPYDVQIVATDGLGELKGALFTAEGAQSMDAVIGSLLARTGLTLDRTYVSSLEVKTPQAVTPSMFFSQVKADLTHLDGQPCYDVLSALLETFNAKITQIDNHWVIFRENDILLTDGQVVSSNGHRFSVVRYGSMSDTEWFPVGQMTNDIVPAKNRLSVTADNTYRSALLDPEFVKGAWTLTNVTRDDDAQGLVMEANATASVSQQISFPSAISSPLAILLKVSATGSGRADGKIAFTIKKVHLGTTTYLSNDPDRNGNTGFRWSTDAGSLVTMPVSSPESGTVDEVSFSLPLYRRTSRDYQMAESLEVTVRQTSDSYGKILYSCRLDAESQLAGYINTIAIANGARGIGDDVSMVLTHIGNDGVGSLLYGIPRVGANTAEIEVASSRFPSSQSLISLITKDYAATNAYPRQMARGTVNVPRDQRGNVLAFVDRNGWVYTVLSSSWSLFDDNMDVEMMTIPIGDIEIEEEELQAVQGGSSASAGGSGGSAGGGSTTSSAKLSSLTDVELDPTALNDGDVLYYSSTLGKWVNYSSNHFGSADGGGSGESGGDSNPYYDDAVIFTFTDGSVVRFPLTNGETQTYMGSALRDDYGKDPERVTKIEIGKNCTRISDRAFRDEYGWAWNVPVYCYGMTAPSVSSTSFYNIRYYEPRLIYPDGASGYNNTFKSYFDSSSTGAVTPGGGSGSGSGGSSGGTVTVIDNLLSFSAAYALSANQGRVLKGLIDTKKLSQLGDAVITDPENGQILKFNGRNWVNSSIGAGVQSVRYDSYVSGGTPVGELFVDGISIGQIYGAGSGSGGSVTLSPATASALGAIRIGYVTSGKNVAIQLDAQSRAYVVVSDAVVKAALGFTPLATRSFYIGTTEVQSQSAKQDLKGIASLECDDIAIGEGRLSYDAANNALKLEKKDGSVINFYATGGVDALGAADRQSDLAARIAALEAKVEALEGR